MCAFLQGFRKPDPQAYARVLQHLGVAPDQVIFVDDRQANVDVGAHGKPGLCVGVCRGRQKMDEGSCTHQACNWRLTGRLAETDVLGINEGCHSWMLCVEGCHSRGVSLVDAVH